MKNFLDPRCLAVSGRHVVDGGREPPYKNLAFARANVLSYSRLLWQRCYTQVDVRSETIRKSTAPTRRSGAPRSSASACGTRAPRSRTRNSLCFRIERGKRADEYMVFDPAAWILRRLDIHGGLDKRRMSTVGFGHRLFQYLHNVVGHYHRSRFVCLYPAYMVLLWYHAASGSTT